jgi:urea transport system permease protein
VLGFSLSADSTRAALFALSGLALAGGLLLSRAITVSKFGKVLVAVRDAESRTRFMGYRVEHYKLFVFVVSAMLAGLAGALYVPQVGIINHGEFSPANSIEIVIWVALGGRGTLVGAALGALIVAAGKSWLTANFPEIWLFVLGATFILVTIFLPRGVLGLFEQTFASRRSKSEPAAAPEPEPAE